MLSPAILAIDQGTTNTKVLLIGAADGVVRARASRPLGVEHPRAGWAEQSAVRIRDGVLGAAADLLADRDAGEVACVAITNQRETVVVWDAATGEPIAPAATWQCRRSSARCAALRAGGHEAAVVARTGLTLDPLFPSAKIGMILDSVPGARARAEAGALKAGTVDSWLLWCLTGGAAHATDASNASRTQLFALDALDWDGDMLNLFDVPRALLPRVRPSDALFGTTADGLGALPAGLPIHAMLGDSHAALLGHALAGEVEAKVTCGTGSSLMAATRTRTASANGLATTVAWTRGAETVFALEGNVAASGHAAAYACELFGMGDEAALTALAASVEDGDGVTFVPALAGLGAPHWVDGARGTLGGLSLGTGRAHVARAVLEGIALQIADVVGAMEADRGAPLAALSVDGGAARNDLLMQVLSDVTARPVLRPRDAEIGAMGVAALAAGALGFDTAGWRRTERDRFAPRMTDEARRALIARWRRAVARAALP